MLISKGQLDSAHKIANIHNLKPWLLYKEFKRNDWKDSLIHRAERWLGYGYNSYYLLTENPKWASLLNEPEYPALLEKARLLNETYRVRCKGVLTFIDEKK